jgi:hypothetical protein
MTKVPRPIRREKWTGRGSTSRWTYSPAYNTFNSFASHIMYYKCDANEYPHTKPELYKARVNYHLFMITHGYTIRHQHPWWGDEAGCWRRTAPYRRESACGYLRQNRVDAGTFGPYTGRRENRRKKQHYIWEEKSSRRTCAAYSQTIYYKYYKSERKNEREYDRRRFCQLGCRRPYSFSFFREYVHRTCSSARPLIIVFFLHRFFLLFSRLPVFPVYGIKSRNYLLFEIRWMERKKQGDFDAATVFLRKYSRIVGEIRKK